MIDYNHEYYQRKLRPKFKNITVKKQMTRKSDIKYYQFIMSKKITRYQELQNFPNKDLLYGLIRSERINLTQLLEFKNAE